MRFDGPLGFVGFFIILSFPLGGGPRGEDSDHVTALGEGDDEEPAVAGVTDDDFSLFRLRVILVVENARERVQKNGESFSEIDPMLRSRNAKSTPLPAETARRAW